RWGIPLVRIAIDYDENDRLMTRDYCDQMSEMFAYAGFKNIEAKVKDQAPGLDIHEMGGARMGHDPKDSVLNKWNQLHDCKNVFVTDGACMTSVSTQNPSLTFMALTARAVDYAVREMKKFDL
ncbi:GMC family oxidoreductase, partial [Parapusillimonas sp. SGNA-6]|nr:GMC family oxidoreductase [Parapusillimonas sp. SGNA-6]